MEEDEYWNISENKAFDFNNEKTIEPANFDHLFTNDETTPELVIQHVTNEIPINLLISEDDLRQVLEEQSIKEIPFPKKIKPDDELKILRRKLQELIYAPLSSTVVTNILMKKPYYLDSFKTFDEKQNLLTEAIASGDGDAILIVMLFLLRSLKPKLFNQILSTVPGSICHSVSDLMYQEGLLDYTNLSNFYGRQSQLAMIQYRLAMKTSSNSKIETLRNVHRNYFNNIDSISFYAQIVTNYITLLEWQQNQIKSNLNLNKTILDKSALESLYYASAASKWDCNSSTLPVPIQQLLDSQKIIQSHYEWIVLNERARNNVWRDLEMIFQKKNWNQLKLKTLSMSIPLDRTILQLSKLQAPEPVLNYFLSNITDATYRLELAQKVGAEKSVINSLLELKDNHRLETYITTIPTGTEIYFYAKNALKNLTGKEKQ